MPAQGARAAARARRILHAEAALLPLLEADRREAELRVALLPGRRPGEVAVSVANDAARPRRDLVPALGVPADLLRRRPDVRRAEREVAAATARIGATEPTRCPRISVGGSLSLQGPDVGDVVDPDAHVLRIGPSLSVPLQDGGRIDARVRVAESRQRESILRMRRVVLGAMADVETAAMRRFRTDERIERLAAAEDAAREAEPLSLDRDRAGAMDLLDVTEARTQRLAISRDRVRAEGESLRRLVELHAALGGGWRALEAPGATAD